MSLFAVLFPTTQHKRADSPLPLPLSSMGFNFSPSRAGYQFFIILIAELYSVTLGQLVAALSPTILVAALCASPLP